MQSTAALVLFGYQSVRLDAPKDELAQGKGSLEAYANREGYCQGTIFVERDLNSPLSALVALMDAAKRDCVNVVAVPTSRDLGQIPRVRHLTRRTLQVEGGLRVLVVEPDR